MTETSCIRLSLIGDTAFCFDADDYMKIRTEYRIIGKLIGCMVKWLRKEACHGLPATYSPYETQLLIDKGFVQLCKKHYTDVPNDTFDKQYEDHCQRNLESAHEMYIEKRIEDAKGLMTKILDGKRKKVMKSGGDPDTITEETILEDVRQRCINDTANVFVQVPTAEPFDVDFEVIESAPNVDPLKYRVFCDLWEKGHWLTTGASFGGDFLLYPGEQYLFHASHIVHVLSQEEASSMVTRTFITRSRLSVSVKKFCTFAYENAETNEICYQTVQWLGK